MARVFVMAAHCQPQAGVGPMSDECLNRLMTIHKALTPGPEPDRLPVPVNIYHEHIGEAVEKANTIIPSAAEFQDTTLFDYVGGQNIDLAVKLHACGNKLEEFTRDCQVEDIQIGAGILACTFEVLADMVSAMPESPLVFTADPIRDNNGFPSFSDDLFRLE